MYKILIISIFLLLGFARYAVVSTNMNKRQVYLLISLFVQLIAFGYGKVLLTFFPGKEFGQAIDRLGAFGNYVELSLYLVVPIFLFLLGYRRLKKLNNIWFFILILLSIISIFNPSNKTPAGTIVCLSFVIPIYITTHYLKSNFSRKTIIRGIYDGLMVITFFQLFLVICYPILGMESVASWFRGEGMLDYSLRRENYVSAVGILGHPGQLALFSLLCLIFFLANYYYNSFKKLSLILVIVNLFIIVLTFSRTTYIAVTVIILLLYVAYNSKTSIVSPSNIVKLVLLIIVFGCLLYLTPVADLFLKSDAESQFENRFAHWYLGFEVFSKSPLLGVGMNSHVYFMEHELKISKDLPILWFLTSNPIHNIHMIILAELGIIGIILWLCFFFSRIVYYSARIKTKYVLNNILNLTAIGILVSLLVYGLFGWSPFNKSILALAIVLISLTEDSKSLIKN